MSYYHEARALVKGMKERVEVNKRNRERRAEQAGIEVRANLFCLLPVASCTSRSSAHYVGGGGR